MSIATRAPTLAKVLASLSAEQKEILFNHQQTGAFHRGRQWFGFGMHVTGNSPTTMSAMAESPCPVAKAFDVELDMSASGWFSAKIDDRLSPK